MGILGRLNLRTTEEESPRPRVSQVTPPSQQLHHDLQRPRRLLSTTRTEFQELLGAQPARTGSSSGSCLSRAASPLLLLGWKNRPKLASNNRLLLRQSTSTSLNGPRSSPINNHHHAFLSNHRPLATRDTYLASSRPPPPHTASDSETSSDADSSPPDFRTRAPTNLLQRSLPAHSRHPHYHHHLLLQAIDPEPCHPSLPPPPSSPRDLLAFYHALPPPNNNPHPLPVRNRFNSYPARP